MNLNKRIKAVTPSVTLAIAAQAKKMKSEGIPVIGFGAGEPDFDTPDYIKDAAIKAINEGFTRYTPASGTEELKQAICDKLQRENGLAYDLSQIVVSCGAKHTLYNLIQVLCNEGDEVLIPAPYWLSYPEMAKMAGAIPVIVNTDESSNYKVTPAHLEKNITDKTRVVILNSPSNPTGMLYDKEELTALAEVILKHDLIVISDEIYEHIIYDNEKHISIASLSPEIYEKTIVVNGHSKAYAMTGWRIGYMAGPQLVAKAVGSLQSHSTSNPCSIAQKAAVAALQGDQSFLSDNVKLFEKRRNRIIELLEEIPGVTCVKPQGAFYVFPNIKGLGMNSMELAERLLTEAQVAIVPGTAFGADDCIRLSYAMDMDSIEEGLQRIKKWVKENV